MGKRFSSTIKICLALFMSVFSTNLMPVMTAHASTFTNHKVTICHATNSQSNPYTINYIDKSSVDEPNNQYLNGHGDHTGPVWYQGIADHSWGDIIPPFTYGNTTFPGRNWTTAGQAIYNNDCEVPPTNVTPTAPTKVDPCGRANDGYIITATPGVKYYKSVWGPDPELSAGFHAEDDDVDIYAVAQNGYKIVGNDDWSFSFTNANCVATPAAPTKSDVCGTQNDTYTIPTTEGVIYKVNGSSSEKPAGTYAGTGTVTIKAYAKSGYVLSGAKEWTFTFSTAPCITTVTPTAPTKAADPCGVQDDKYTIPATTGVIYKVNGVETSAGTYSANGASVSIKAYPASNAYALSGTTEWTLDFNTDACPITVVPTAPTHVDVCGNFNDTYTIPAKTGVTYKVNGAPTSAGTYSIWVNPSVTSYTVTAESAGNPYVIDGAATWTFDFTNTACNSASIGQPEGCVDRNSHDGLFTVTVANSSETESTYVVLVGGVLTDSATVAAHATHTFVLDGYNPGTYSVAVLKATYTGVLPAGMPLPPFVFAGPSDWQYKDVLSGDVTIEQCPCEHEEEPPVDACPDAQGIQTDPADCAAIDPGQGGGTPATPPTTPGQVLGDSTGGHILATSTNTPNVLPNTGSAATNPWLTIVAAAIAFLAARAITRRKLLNDQI